jgi:hypothetical protein
LSFPGGPFTSAFLEKFYAVFEDEITTIRKNQITGNTGQERILEEIDKTQTDLEDRYQQLFQSHQLIVGDVLRLEQKLNGMLEERLDKIEVLLSRLTTHKKDSPKD